MPYLNSLKTLHGNTSTDTGRAYLRCVCTLSPDWHVHLNNIFGKVNADLWLVFNSKEKILKLQLKIKLFNLNVTTITNQFLILSRAFFEWNVHNKNAKYRRNMR